MYSTSLCTVQSMSHQCTVPHSVQYSQCHINVQYLTLYSRVNVTINVQYITLYSRVNVTINVQYITLYSRVNVTSMYSTSLCTVQSMSHQCTVPHSVQYSQCHINVQYLTLYSTVNVTSMYSTSLCTVQ